MNKLNLSVDALHFNLKPLALLLEPLALLFKPLDALFNALALLLEPLNSLFNALAEIADDECLKDLKELLFKGGLLARPGFARSAAARTLQKIGTPAARALLDEGNRSLNPAIRRACRDVTKQDP